MKELSYKEVFKLQKKLFIGAMLLLVLGFYFTWSEEYFWGAILILLSCGLSVFSKMRMRKYFRCPHCGELLGTKALFTMPSFCSSCGEKLSDE